MPRAQYMIISFIICIRGSMRVTFDINTFDKASRPAIYSKDPEHGVMIVVHEALRCGRIQSFISETAITLDGITNDQRATEFAKYLNPQFEFEALPQERSPGLFCPASQSRRNDLPGCIVQRNGNPHHSVRYDRNGPDERRNSSRVVGESGRAVQRSGISREYDLMQGSRHRIWELAVPTRDQ